MRIGIFGGAFNPVHKGHINLAEFYIRELKLDKLLVIPTADPPHRSAEDFAAESCRFEMLRIAFKDTEKAEISDIEFKRKAKSYTYTTLLELKKLFPSSELFLIIGEDQFLSFDKWYRFEEIIKLAAICTAARGKSTERELEAYASVKLKNAEYRIAKTVPVIASSSEIRDRIKENKSISDLVPPGVEKYIKDNFLYV